MPVVVLVLAAMRGSVCVNSQPQPCRQKLMKTPCGELVTSFGERSRWRGRRERDGRQRWIERVSVLQGVSSIVAFDVSIQPTTTQHESSPLAPSHLPLSRVPLTCTLALPPCALPSRSPLLLYPRSSYLLPVVLGQLEHRSGRGQEAHGQERAHHSSNVTSSVIGNKLSEENS